MSMSTSILACLHCMGRNRRVDIDIDNYAQQPEATGPQVLRVLVHGARAGSLRADTGAGECTCTKSCTTMVTHRNEGLAK